MLRMNCIIVIFHIFILFDDGCFRDMVRIRTGTLGPSSKNTINPQITRTGKVRTEGTRGCSPSQSQNAQNRTWLF